MDFTGRQQSLAIKEPFGQKNDKDPTSKMIVFCIFCSAD